MFDTDGFTPKGACSPAWTEILTAEYVGAEALTFLTYMLISVVFATYLRSRHVVVLRPIFLMLSFVFAFCGTTHLIGLLMFFWPAFRFDAIFRMVSALIGVGAALKIYLRLPAIMKMPRAGQEMELYEEVYQLRCRLTRMEADEQRTQVLQSAIEAIRSKGK
jgi:hypothetical protein